MMLIQFLSASFMEDMKIYILESRADWNIYPEGFHV